MTNSNSQILYPDNWKELATSIKAAKDWKCQQCGKICIKPGQKIPDEWSNYQRRAYTLQVHHWNRNPADNRVSNLAALCPGCHLFYHTRGRGNISPGQLSFFDKLGIDSEGETL
jgi:predicted HNH restriction endonuclease